MNGIYRFKENFEKLYSSWGNYFIALGKCLTAFLLFHQINGRMGHMAALANIFLELILALFCSFLPMNTTVVLGAVFVLGQLFGLSLPALIVGGSILIIVLMVYFCFAPKEVWALLLTALALAFHIPCIAPLVLGLLGSPLAGVGIACGIVLYYTCAALQDLGNTAAMVTLAGESAGEALPDTVRSMMDAVLGEQEMILMLFTLLAAFVVVYFSRRLAMKYAWTVAIAAGTLIYLVLAAAGGLMLEMRLGLVEILLGTLISCLIAVILEFLFFHLDYTKTEKLQFEDDEYYYYVQAVPKKRLEKKKKR